MAHGDFINSTANCGPRSLVICQGSLCIFHMLSQYNSIVVTLWSWLSLGSTESMMARITLWPFHSSRGPIRSADMSSQGPPGMLWGCNGFALGSRDALFHWQVSQPLMYFFTSVSSVGHQYCHLISLLVLKIPGWPATGVSWVAWSISYHILGSGSMYTHPLNNNSPASIVNKCGFCFSNSETLVSFCLFCWIHSSKFDWMVIVFAPLPKNCSSLNNVTVGDTCLMKCHSGSMVTLLGGGNLALYHGSRNKISAFEFVAPRMCLSV